MKENEPKITLRSSSWKHGTSAITSTNLLLSIVFEWLNEQTEGIRHGFPFFLFARGRKKKPRGERCSLQICLSLSLILGNRKEGQINYNKKWTFTLFTDRRHRNGLCKAIVTRNRNSHLIDERTWSLHFSKYRAGLGVLHPAADPQFLRYVPHVFWKVDTCAKIVRLDLRSIAIETTVVVLWIERHGSTIGRKYEEQIRLLQSFIIPSFHSCISCFSVRRCLVDSYPIQTELGGDESNFARI